MFFEPCARWIAAAILSASAAIAAPAAASPPTARFDAAPPAPKPVAAATATPPASAAPSSPSVPSPPAVAPAKRPESWATRAARELSDRAARARARGDGGDALRLYTEAVRMDPSYGPAFLGLGELRAALGDPGEAERVFALALGLPSASADAYAARARLRYRRGDRDGAVTDMEASLAVAPGDAPRLLQLAGWHVARQGWAAALVSWRRLLVLYERTDQSSAADHARTQVRALTVLAAESDPVHGIGGAHPSWVRRALARIAVRLPESD